MRYNRFHIKYLRVSSIIDSRISIELKSGKLASLQACNPPPQGYAHIEIQQCGSCKSELTYYLGTNGQIPRFFLNRLERPKIEQSLESIVKSGIQKSDIVKDVLMTSFFHEAFAKIIAVNPDEGRAFVPVQVYVPIGNKHDVYLKREIINTNFQSIKKGDMVVLNPAYICDCHSSSNNIDVTTGWPYQCGHEYHSSNGLERQFKATRGHTNAFGVTIKGIIPVSLDSLTAVPLSLKQFVLEDYETRRILLTCTEPFACVYQAHGQLLAHGQPPESVTIIGDGPSTLLIAMFYQIYSPNSKLLVIGKSLEKLEAIKNVNSQKITILINDGNTLSQVSKSELVIPTVILPKDEVISLLKPNGMVIWWPAEISQGKSNTLKSKTYREFYSYGGAPRGEMSAVLGLDYLCRFKPWVIEAFVSYPGFFHVKMGKKASITIQDWFNREGEFSVSNKPLRTKVFIDM